MAETRVWRFLTPGKTYDIKVRARIKGVLGTEATEEHECSDAPVLQAPQRSQSVR